MQLLKQRCITIISSIYAEEFLPASRLDSSLVNPAHNQSHEIDLNAIIPNLHRNVNEHQKELSRCSKKFDKVTIEILTKAIALYYGDQISMSRGSMLLMHSYLQLLRVTFLIVF